jgi:hypothetical protein
LLGHGFDAPATHAPLPSHELVASKPLLHVVPHIVVLGGYTHAVVLCAPSHVPPHAVPCALHFGREPCGAPCTGVHVPTDPATSQAWHSPSQAALQHTPSMQKPLPHWEPLEHCDPLLPLSTHLLPGPQYALLSQSMSVVHVVLHWPVDVRHKYGEHGMPVVVTVHEPPLHTCPLTLLVAESQLVAPHATPLCAIGRHAPVPSQLPSALQFCG